MKKTCPAKGENTHKKQPKNWAKELVICGRVVILKPHGHWCFAAGLFVVLGSSKSKAQNKNKRKKGDLFAI